MGHNYALVTMYTGTSLFFIASEQKTNQILIRRHLLIFEKTSSLTCQAIKQFAAIYYSKKHKLENPLYSFRATLYIFNETFFKQITEYQ